jgi:hypothetical protein
MMMETQKKEQKLFEHTGGTNLSSEKLKAKDEDDTEVNHHKIGM